MSDFSLLSCPVRNASIEVAPSRAGGRAFEATVQDDVLPVVVAGRQLDVVNVETITVAGGCSVELESVGSGLDGDVEGSGLDGVVGRVEATDDDVVPEDIAP